MYQLSNIKKKEKKKTHSSQGRNSGWFSDMSPEGWTEARTDNQKT